MKLLPFVWTRRRQEYQCGKTRNDDIPLFHHREGWSGDDRETCRPLLTRVGSRRTGEARADADHRLFGFDISHRRL